MHALVVSLYRTMIGSVDQIGQQNFGLAEPHFLEDSIFRYRPHMATSKTMGSLKVM